ncbi:MAG: cupin domain-containing protein [Moorea sp. SIO4G2]|nr:cupin domain-containing protein [Moorena sp. SIO4G2]
MSYSKSKMDLEQLKNKWQEQGLICEVWELYPGDSWSDPGHKTDEFFVLLEGQMKVSCQGKVSNLEIGQEIMVPAKEPHTVSNHGETAGRVCWIHQPDFA